jgi:hypothetical protein
MCRIAVGERATVARRGLRNGGFVVFRMLYVGSERGGC